MVGIEADRGLSNRLANDLEKKLADVRGRLDSLAGQRAPYVNLVAEVNQCREQVRIASVSLAEVRGRQEASLTSSLITRIDTPVTGSNPLGPGRSTILVGSSLVGLLLGLSLVYLLAPWQERARNRRKSDMILRRRQTDLNDKRVLVAPATAPVAEQAVEASTQQAT